MNMECIYLFIYLLVYQVYSLIQEWNTSNSSTFVENTVFLSLNICALRSVAIREVLLMKSAIQIQKRTESRKFC